LCGLGLYCFLNSFTLGQILVSMRQSPLRATVAVAAALLLLLLATVAQALPHDETPAGDMSMDMNIHTAGAGGVSPAPQNVSAVATSDSHTAPVSYFAYKEHSTVILAHIILMVIAWCFVLPIGM
jgi:hypothetical protein